MSDTNEFDRFCTPSKPLGDTSLMVVEIKRLERENARLQMEVDASCNAEELRQVRAENAALRISVNRLRRALLDCSDAAIGGSTLATWIRGKVTATLSKEDGS